MSSNPPSPRLDHIVILVTYATLETLSERLQQWFVIAPGGTHADGLTANKLILLPDGVYLEFIAFVRDVDPDRRRNHRWGTQTENTIIDWALTLPTERDFPPVQQRVQASTSGFKYQDLVAGGRRRDDGTILEWVISTAIDSLGDATPPGRLPFWCLDRTPRGWRVPYQEQPDLIQHPSQVLGISSVAVSAPEAQISGLAAAYNAISAPGDLTTATTRDWHYEVPSGSPAGKRTISLSGNGQGTNITFAFHGPVPGRIELLPGLVLTVE
ncbi:glyoxalase-like domain-containing protein [Aspergillus avenaceus]|uniref:Glyoxalase-like domain-containing protein n=1 Tax=Aspergillus avenaceus TaxID=36643 RepID=A0A5N6TJS8_ASPAV|nr:glyoxalase-like domain-containing protein [Aspergillus avenaceus]